MLQWDGMIFLLFFEDCFGSSMSDVGYSLPVGVFLGDQRIVSTGLGYPTLVFIGLSKGGFVVCPW